MNRLELQSLLEELLGSNNVYYRKPENLKISYPAIVYDLDIITSKHADNIKYHNRDRYQIIVIDKNPDNVVIKKILEKPYTSFQRHYISDNLNHDVITIYY